MASRPGRLYDASDWDGTKGEAAMDDRDPRDAAGRPRPPASSEEGPERLLLFIAIAALAAMSIVDIFRLITRSLPPAW